MPLEATIIIIDNSEYMRNGDYPPTRFDAQSDAVNTVFGVKIDSNPENSVGLMTMAGKGPEVLVTNTKDLGQMLQAIHATSSKIGGSIDLPTAISTAQLALKHRQNKNLRQRILVFIASPLEGPSTDERNMVKLAKKLKKNNVAVDVIAFGDAIDDSENPVLKAFVENASSSDNSHYLAIPPGPHLLSDAVISSVVLAADRGIPEDAIGGGPAASTSGAANNFEFGVDPSLDPELAMALRMSMEEEQARQAAAAKATKETGAPSAPEPSSAEPEVAMDEDEEALLKQALALSEGQDVDMTGHQEEEGHEEDEDEEIARAIAMSMEESTKESKEKK
ncbi:proteasome subunit S5A family protein [Abortiporus biennis]